MVNRDDRVVYVGSKFAKELGGKIGEVVAKIDGEKDGFVVEFGGDAYVMPGKSLSKYKATSKEDTGPEVHQKRRKRDDDEE